MSGPTMKPLEAMKTAARRPPFEPYASVCSPANFIRDQFTITTWLAFGAAAQVVLFLLPLKPYYAAIPVVSYLASEILGTISIMIGLRSDPVLAKALASKYTAIVPDEEGTFRMGSKGQKVAIFLLGFRIHHHIGMLAPGFPVLFRRASEMFQDLEKHADEVGILGLSRYASSGNTKTNAEIMTIMYFKSNDDVIRYANGPLHRAAWDWFNKVSKDYPHLGIMHELYEAQPGAYEGIWKNIEPNLLAATQHKAIDQEGNEIWMSPLVDAHKGKAATHNGRLAG